MKLHLNRTRKRRLGFVILLLSGGAAATALMLYALGQNLLYFYSPTQVMAGEAPDDQIYRLGGMVEAGSVKREPDGLTTRFVLTDYDQRIPLVYTGLLPDLFREGQGIVAHGKLDADGVFTAERLEAKHDENYMPPEVAAALKAGEQAKANKQGGTL